MTTSLRADWVEANQRYLAAALATVRAALERHIALARGEGPGEDAAERAGQELATRAAEFPGIPAVERLRAVFGLSSFEHAVLLLCAGMELDAAFGPLCAAAQGDPQRAYPTWSLALAALPNPHWSALAPNGPLRRWRLIEVGPGRALTLSPLRIDECVLHHLAGVQHLDERLAGIVEPVAATEPLVPSRQAIAERVSDMWARAAHPLPLVQLCGADAAGRSAVAASACKALGLDLYAMSAQSIPAVPGDLDSLAVIWTREAVLSSAALLLECDDLDLVDAGRAALVGRFVERLRAPVLISGRERLRLRQRAAVVFDVPSPTSGEQRRLWQGALGGAASQLNGAVDALVSQFNLSGTAIHAAASEARARLGQGEADLARLLWESSRAQARPRLDDLAQRIEPVAGWDDLVLPEAQHRTLREIALHVRHRTTVYEDWGFAGRGARGLGISALFAGASGTGKTMAAEVLANDLHLDLYRIDLSSVVSKYIGETEKNLRRVFDAAEEGGAILLFDEADALFGKRSEVKDSHDRYANIEVSYLLQRMESYRGLAILTTNLKSALDTAFLRRIRFIVQFPFPNAGQRAEIWRRIFPPETPTAGLDYERLAQLNVAGGNIRSIALSAAFLAAGAGEPVGMHHILQAARTEYAKLEKPLTESEIGGWT